jgi:hypothetical protein
LFCQFCSQWNLPESMRCSFCNNRLDNTDDATRGQPSSKSPGSSLPLITESAIDQPSEIAKEMVMAGKIWQGIVAAGVGLVLLFYLLGRCS